MDKYRSRPPALQPHGDPLVPRAKVEAPPVEWTQEDQDLFEWTVELQN